MKESQRKGYCSRHLTVNSREERQSLAYCLSSGESVHQMGTSLEQRDKIQQRFDENDAANMLVSLSDHQSTTTNPQMPSEMAARNPRLPPDVAGTNLRLLPGPTNTSIPPTLTTTYSQIAPLLVNHQSATGDRQLASQCSCLQTSATQNCWSQSLQRSLFTENSSVTTCRVVSAANIPVHVMDQSLGRRAVTSAGTCTTSSMRILCQDTSCMLTTAHNQRPSPLTLPRSVYLAVDSASVPHSKALSQLTTAATTTTAVPHDCTSVMQLLTACDKKVLKCCNASKTCFTSPGSHITSHYSNVLSSWLAA